MTLTHSLCGAISSRVAQDMSDEVAGGEEHHKSTHDLLPTRPMCALEPAPEHYSTMAAKGPVIEAELVSGGQRSPDPSRSMAHDTSHETLMAELATVINRAHQVDSL